MYSALATSDPAWAGLLRRLPPAQADVHFLPGYARIYERTYGVEAGLSVWSEGEHFAAMPFILRPLDALPFLKEQGRMGFLDAATPYGYGGPVFRAEGPEHARELVARLDRAHLEHLAGRGAATEFLCLHPLLANHEPLLALGLPAEPRKRVAVADLLPDEAALWAGLNRGNKSSINKARRAGVRVERAEPTPELLALFESMYRATMARQGAAERWLFPDGYFARCAEELGPGCLFFLARTADGRAASCFQVLLHGPTAYYHFAGTDEAFFHLRPNNLLMWEVMLACKALGCAALHLGGGVSEDEGDSLMRYKLGFTRRTEVLHTLGRVVRADVYEELCGLKRGHERRTLGPEQARALDASPGGGYFPLYRR